jgi:hypothetical protein
MSTKRNLTNPDATPDWSLSEQQLTAIDLLVTGKNLQETADHVGVQRPTVSGWVNHHAGFQAALNKRRQELWGDLVDGLRALAPKAVQVLGQALESAESVSAAIHVLKACGLYGQMPAPSGPTAVEAVALAMKLAEDDRQHAAETAEITIKRRGFDRMLAQLAADPTAGGWTPGP